MRAIEIPTLVSVELTVSQLAEVIVGLGSDEQALLISKMAEHIDFNAPMQLEYVRQDKALTKEGRQLMCLIGDYAEESNA